MKRIMAAVFAVALAISALAGPVAAHHVGDAVPNGNACRGQGHVEHAHMFGGLGAIPFFNPPPASGVQANAGFDAEFC